MKIRALAAAALLAAVSMPAAAERPVADFTAPEAVSWAKISPGGKRIAAEMDVDGERKLTIIPLDGQGERIVIGLGEGDLNRVDWVNDDWLIASVGRQGYFDGHEIYISRITALRSDGGDMQILEPRGSMADSGGDVLWVARDGTPRILLAYRQSIYVDEEGFYPQVSMVDVSTSDFSRVVGEMEGVWDWYADGSGVVRVGIGQEKGGRRERLVYRDGESKVFREIARAAANSDEELIVPELFLAEPGKALARSNRNGYEALYELDLETMTLGDKVFGVDGYDVGGLIRDPSGTRLLGVTWVDSRSRVKWFDDRMQATQDLLEASLPGKRVSIVSSSASALRHVVLVTGEDGLDGFYFFDGQQKRLVPLAKDGGSGPWAGTRVARYDARDGLEIEAILTMPLGREAKNLPVLVMPHGGPRARDYQSWDTWAQFFADRGYLVIQPNFRGSTGYGVAFEKAGLGEWGLKMQDDVDDALAWAASEGLADPARACIIGGSYGGYVAMRAAQRNPDLYRCAISFAGVSDLGKMVRHDSNAYFGPFLKDYWKGQVSDLDAVSPVNHIDEFGIPLLLVHGKEDQRVPVAQSRAIFKKLKAAKKDVDYIEQKKGDHHFSRDEDMEEFLLAAEKFLDKYNPAD